VSIVSVCIRASYESPVLLMLFCYKPKRVMLSELPVGCVLFCLQCKTFVSSPARKHPQQHIQCFACQDLTDP
jgi:hypothetical protein